MSTIRCMSVPNYRHFHGVGVELWIVCCSGVFWQAPGPVHTSTRRHISMTSQPKHVQFPCIFLCVNCACILLSSCTKNLPDCKSKGAKSMMSLKFAVSWPRSQRGHHDFQGLKSSKLYETQRKYIRCCNCKLFIDLPETINWGLDGFYTRDAFIKHEIRIGKQEKRTGRVFIFDYNTSKATSELHIFNS